MRQPTGYDWARNTSTRMSRRCLEVRHPVRTRSASARFYRLCDANSPILSSRLLHKSRLLTRKICSIHNDCTRCHNRMNIRARTSLSTDVEHRYRGVTLKLTENTNAGGNIHQHTWRPSVCKEQFCTSVVAHSVARRERARLQGKYGSHSTVRRVSSSVHKSPHKMANDTPSKFHPKLHKLNRMSPKYTNSDRLSVFLKSENSKSSENVSNDNGSETESNSFEYPVNIMWEFEQNNAKPEDIIKLIPKTAGKILNNIKKSVRKQSERRKASVSASPTSSTQAASPRTETTSAEVDETEPSNVEPDSHAKTADCWGSLKEQVNRHTSPIKDKMKLPRFQAIKDKLGSLKSRRVPGHQLEKVTKPRTQKTGDSSPEAGKEKISTYKPLLFRKPSILKQSIGQPEKPSTPSTNLPQSREDKTRMDKSKVPSPDKKALSRNRDKIHPPLDDTATVDEAKARQKDKPEDVDPFYESFLDDLNAEFLLRGPQKDTDLLMKQLRLNALKLVELEQEYRAGKLQPIGQKKQKKKKKKTSASPMSASPQEPLRDELIAPQNVPVEMEAAKEMDTSILNHEEGGVVHDLLDHGVLSPSEVVEAAHEVHELTETLALPIAETGFPDLTSDVPKPFKKIKEADATPLTSFEIDGVQTENVDSAAKQVEPVKLDAKPEMSVQSDRISEQISASKNETYLGVGETSRERSVDVNADRIAHSPIDKPEDAIMTTESSHTGSDAMNATSRAATKDELDRYIPTNTSLFRLASDAVDSTKSTFTQKTKPTTPDSPVKGGQDVSVDAVQDSKTGFMPVKATPDSLQTAAPSDFYQGFTIRNSLLEILCSKRQMSTWNLPQKLTDTDACRNVLGRYRSSVQKIRHISAMTPERIHSGLIRYSNSTYTSLLSPSSSKLRTASEFPPRARRVNLRMNKQLHQLDNVCDLRTSILPEPRVSRTTPAFDYPEPFRFAPQEQTAEHLVSSSDPKYQAYSLHEKSAGDLIKPRTTPKKLAENFLHFEIRSPSSVVTKSGEEVKGAKAVRPVGIGQKNLDNHLPHGPAIHIRCTRPEPSAKKKLGDTADQPTIRSKTAQPQESDLVVWQKASQLSHIPGEEHRSVFSPSFGSTQQDASLFSPKSCQEYRSASAKLIKELERLQLCSRSHHRSADLLKRKHRRNCHKLISVTWNNGWQNNTSSSPVTLNPSDDVNSKALTESTNPGLTETSVQLGQADRISVESAEAAGPLDRSDDITFSICITERSDSSSSHCSDKMAKFIEENRHLFALHDCQERKPCCRTELLCCCSDDSDSQRSEDSHCWCETEERRRCCCRTRRAGRRACSSTSSRELNPFRLYHLATNLKNISTQLVYRQLKTLLLKRVLLKRALTERIMEDLCRIRRLGR
ncbi:hypothetical protein CRM22_010692 [Opisthorchis felineus]|uniref:Uncharacterized protein n=1 Tax=Opisthorchis felineus TaxID=147828 RepID=A0A4S2KRV0_OPIFE|nr:hypothetical protein CRM22_010692 [Opisthorchis felineus]